MLPMSRPAAPPMRHRSYYLHTDVADRLERVVDDLHFTTRKPKHAVLSAAVAVALEHEAEIRARLTADGPGGEA